MRGGSPSSVGDMDDDQEDFGDLHLHLLFLHGQDHGSLSASTVHVGVGFGGLLQWILPIDGGADLARFGEFLEDDEILELSGVRIFLDPFSMQYLEGVEIDYVTSMMGSGFTFRNPNATGGCGCGSSFTA